MLYNHITLIDQSGKVSHAELTEVAAALQTQVNHHLAEFWPVRATISTQENGTALRAGVWPVYIVDQLPPGEGGYHMTTSHNQPYAVVVYGADWPLDASHEVCEMLIDPYGNRLQRAPRVRLVAGEQATGISDQAYLLEASRYFIDGIAVSDFITPHFYAAATTGARYSFTGTLTRPLEVAFGGYITWFTSTGEAWQLTWLEEGQPAEIVDLGPTNGARNLREWVDGQVARRRFSAARTPALAQAPAQDASPVSGAAAAAPAAQGEPQPGHG